MALFCAWCDVVVAFGLADAEREASIPPAIWPRALPPLLRAAGRDLDGNSAIVVLEVLLLLALYRRNQSDRRDG